MGRPGRSVRIRGRYPCGGADTSGRFADGDLAAIYDWVNDRIQVVDGAGQLVRVVPLEHKNYRDLDILASGDIVLLRGGPEPAIVTLAPGRHRTDTHKLDPSIEAIRLVVDGPQVYVWAEGDRSYPVLRADGPVAVAQQVKLAREGYAVSTWSVAARKKDRSQVELSVSASTSGS